MGGATTEDSGDISEKELVRQAAVSRTVGWIFLSIWFFFFLQLEKLLSQERAARHDLEMHSDGLRRQKTMLLSDIEELKQHLQKSMYSVGVAYNVHVHVQYCAKKGQVE